MANGMIDLSYYWLEQMQKKLPVLLRMMKEADPRRRMTGMTSLSQGMARGIQSQLMDSNELTARR